MLANENQSPNVTIFLELFLKSCDQRGARTASFGIIGHQTPGNENFLKGNNKDPYLVFPPILVVN
jgi:hypothetical protein